MYLITFLLYIADTRILKDVLDAEAFKAYTMDVKKQRNDEESDPEETANNRIKPSQTRSKHGKKNGRPKGSHTKSKKMAKSDPSSFKLKKLPKKRGRALMEHTDDDESEVERDEESENVKIIKVRLKLVSCFADYRENIHIWAFVHDY